MTTSPASAFSPLRDPLLGASVAELRQYTLAPGRRSELVEVFERELVETQERTGMGVGGLYLDRDDADRFVWWRGFASMESRHAALTAFYGGPAWAAHGPTANATMLDSDDVLLLRPTDPARPPFPAVPRPPMDVRSGTGLGAPEWHVACVYRHRPEDDVASWFAADVHTVLERALRTPVAVWRTEPARNTFPRLPVRPDTVVVWTASFPDERAHHEARAALQADPRWRDDVEPELDHVLTGRQYLRLQPTPRSRHPGRQSAG